MKKPKQRCTGQNNAAMNHFKAAMTQVKKLPQKHLEDAWIMQRCNDIKQRCFMSKQRCNSQNKPDKERCSFVKDKGRLIQADAGCFCGQQGCKKPLRPCFEFPQIEMKRCKRAKKFFEVRPPSSVLRRPSSVWCPNPALDWSTMGKPVSLPGFRNISWNRHCS